MLERMRIGLRGRKREETMAPVSNDQSRNGEQIAEEKKIQTR